MYSTGNATIAAIDPATLYKIMALRTEVFIFEQQILSEPELDGRDLEPTTTLFWIQDGAAGSDADVLATLRVLADEPAVHIGRVATAKHARGRGLAGSLLESVFEMYPSRIEISAQAYLETWYERYGFVRTGDNYLEAAIDHVPMARAGS